MSLDDSRLIPPKSYLDAIEVIASEGLKASRPSVRMMLLWLISALALLFLLVALFLGNGWKEDREELNAVKSELEGLSAAPEPLRKLAKPSVAVFLPKLDSPSVGSNAKRQLEGFELAFKQHGVVDTKDKKVKKIEYFNYPFEKDDPGPVLKTIEELYDAGIRTFIITMSGAVTLVSKKFTEWADTLDPRDRPVLVATVASAPEIADSKSGVFRHYIRSKDESSVISTYIETLDDPEVFVVYIDDEYGRNAMEIFGARLHVEQGAGHRIAINPKLGKTDIESLIDQKIVKNNEENRDAVVVIVGYGGMVEKALLSLWNPDQKIWKFEGEILIVSTFTEKVWRPAIAESNKLFRERIHTVGPRPQDSAEKRGVVFQFSFLTLDRALHCDQKRGVKEFTDCWVENEPSRTSSIATGWADVEFTTDGDSHVSLQLLDHTQW